MHRVKLLFVSAIIQMLPAICVAELPQDLDEVLFGLSGCVDYSQWVRTVGVIKFRTPIGIFNEAEFSSRQERPEWEPTHNLIQMHSILDGSESFSNAVSSVKGVENMLLGKLGYGSRMFSHDEFANSYGSVCTNIDGCGWTAKFAVKPWGNGQKTTQPCMVTAVFNKTPLDTNTCEDLFLLPEMTNGLESGFEYHFASTTTSNDVLSGASENAFIKCPIIMCQPRHAYVALADETQTNLNPWGLDSDSEITFKRPIGPFHSATIKMFNPSIPILNHNFFAEGQIESIVATSIVWYATFEECKAELMDAKKAFERYGIEFDITEDKTAGECEFKTKSPTWGGWMVSLSVRRMTKWEFASIMTLSRKRPENRASSASIVPVDVDI